MPDTIFIQTMNLDRRRWWDQATHSHPRRTLTEFDVPVHFTYKFVFKVHLLTFLPADQQSQMVKGT